MTTKIYRVWSDAHSADLDNDGFFFPTIEKARAHVQSLADHTLTDADRWQPEDGEGWNLGSHEGCHSAVIVEVR